MAPKLRERGAKREAALDRGNEVAGCGPAEDAWGIEGEVLVEGLTEEMVKGTTGTGEGGESGAGEMVGDHEEDLERELGYCGGSHVCAVENT